MKSGIGNLETRLSVSKPFQRWSFEDKDHISCTQFILSLAQCLAYSRGPDDIWCVIKLYCSGLRHKREAEIQIQGVQTHLPKNMVEKRNMRS